MRIEAVLFEENSFDPSIDGHTFREELHHWLDKLRDQNFRTFLLDLALRFIVATFVLKRQLEPMQLLIFFTLAAAFLR